MSRIIRTYSDMCEERERLKSLLVIQKKRVSDDWTAVKDGLLPVKNVFRAMGKMTHGDKSNPLVNAGLKLASDLFLKNFVLAKAGWAARLAVPFVVKNYSSHLLAGKAGNFIERIGHLFSKKKTKSYAGQEQKNSEYGGAEQGSQPN